MVVINGTTCICLGHSYTEGILKHAYFGSDKVVKDLKAMPGWDRGLIELRNGCIKKGKDMMINALVYNGPKLAVA